MQIKMLDRLAIMVQHHRIQEDKGMVIKHLMPLQINQIQGCNTYKIQMLNRSWLANFQGKELRKRQHMKLHWQNMNLINGGKSFGRLAHQDHVMYGTALSQLVRKIMGQQRPSFLQQISKCHKTH